MGPYSKPLKDAQQHQSYGTLKSLEWLNPLGYLNMF